MTVWINIMTITNLITAFALSTMLSAPDQLLADRIVAIVEDEIITMRDLMKTLPQGTNDSNLEPMLKEALEQKIDSTLMKKEVEAMGEQLQVTENDVDKAIDEIAKMNHMTMEQLREAVLRQNMVWSSYRRDIREQIEQMRLVQYKVYSRVIISEQAVTAACEAQTGASMVSSVELAHILIKADEYSSHDELLAASATAQKVYAELVDGLNWESAVNRYSADKGDGSGRLGSFSRGQIFEEVERVAFSMGEGEFSAPVHTPLGYHIIKVLKRVVDSADRCQDEAFLTDIKNKMYQEEQQRQMQAFLEGLRRKAFIEIKPLI